MNQAHRASLLEFEGASYSSRCLLRYRNEARSRDTIKFGIEKDECMVVKCLLFFDDFLPPSRYQFCQEWRHEKKQISPYNEEWI